METLLGVLVLLVNFTLAPAIGSPVTEFNSRPEMIPWVVCPCAATAVSMAATIRSLVARSLILTSVF